MNGRLVEVLTFWGDPVQADTERYVYDSNGKELTYSRIGSVADGFSDTGEPLIKWITVSYTSLYDNGRLVKYIGNDGAYEMSGSHYTMLRHDTLGNIIERIYQDTIKHEATRLVSAYDKSGKEILNLNYNAHNDITAFEVTSYDDEGRKTASELRNAGKYSAYRTTTLYFYDDAGKLIKEERLDDGKPDPTGYWYNYDSSGLLTEIKSNIMNDSIEYTYY